MFRSFAISCTLSEEITQTILQLRRNECLQNHQHRVRPTWQLPWRIEILAEQEQTQGKLKTILLALFTSRAVMLSASARLWQLIAATGTMLMMTHFFSGEVQGYYSVILSLIAIQMIFDLGLNGILMLLTSHEWAELRLDDGQVVGDVPSRNRLAAILRFARRWSVCSAILFASVVMPIGLVVLASPKTAGIPAHEWTGPWITSVLLNAAGMLLAPKLSILEGCHQVVPLHQTRLLQSIAGSITVWSCIAGGLGLWTMTASILVRVLFELHLVEVRFRGLFRSLLDSSTASTFCWRRDVWPLQWRLAIQSVGSYFSTSYIVPVTFRYQGEVLAGQVGFTWQLLTTIQSASLAWIQTYLPRMGSMIAAGRIVETEKEMFRSVLRSTIVQVVGISLFFAGLHASNYFGLNLASRFLPTAPILLFAAGFIGLNAIWGIHSYVRLFRKDPFLLFAIIYSVLMFATIQYFGRHARIEALAAGFAAIVWLFGLPVSLIILRKHRKT